MFVSAATMTALDRIDERANDVNMAFTPGAIPAHGDAATARDASQPSLDPLSVAAPDDAYFVTTDERGKISYTRDGTCAFKNGTLLGSNGRPMLGSVGGEALGEMHADAVDSALGRVSNLHIDADGRVVYSRASIDPRSGKRETERVQIGRLALARFSAGTKLVPVDANHFRAPTGVAPHVGLPGDGNFANVRPMQREMSRVDIDASLQRLGEAYRVFEATQAAHAAKGNVSKTIMDLVK